MTPEITRRGVLGLVAMAAAGCTAKGAAYNPATVSADGRTGIIHVYRPLGTMATRGESPFVRIGGKSHGRMKAGSFIAVPMPEGDVKVTVQQSLFLLMPTIPRSVTVTVVAGGSSYVRLDQKIDGADVGGGVSVSQSVEIEEVSIEVGQAEIESTRQNG